MCGNKFTYEIATFGLESSSPQFITGGTKLPRSYDITLHYRGVAASHVQAMNRTHSHHLRAVFLTSPADLTRFLQSSAPSKMNH